MSDSQKNYPFQRSSRSLRRGQGPAVIGFLLPNLLGFLAFTLLPVLFAFWMSFTNWSLKPVVHIHYIGLRNFTDLMGVRPLDQSHPILAWSYGISAITLLFGLVGILWVNMGAVRGSRIGGLALALLGFILTWAGLEHGSQAILIAGIAILSCGGFAAYREGTDWRPGWGMVPALSLVGAVVIMGSLNSEVWRLYEPKDAHFWKYFYNTLYLMIGIPFSIAGSLIIALLLNEDLPLGSVRNRIVGSLLCLAGGLISLPIIWKIGDPNIALLFALLWLIAALGLAFNVVTFRTLFYLPTFTAGVALMILWKALYNPVTGPINIGLLSLFHLFGMHGKPPGWLGSVTWSKPALIIMGVWTSIGGTNMLLYLAGLSNVPRELLDAAAVDGAGQWHRFRHVTWPQLAPTTFFISVMSIIGGLQGGFDQARVMTAGGPAGSTTTLSYYIYNKAFQDLNLGYAAAISWALFAVVFIATAINWKFGRGLEVE